MFRFSFLFLAAVSAVVSSKSIDELTALRKLLLDNDERLLRHDVKDSTFEYQAQHCPEEIPKLMDVVKDEKASLEAKAIAMEIGAICVTERPSYRKILAATNAHVNVVALLAEPTTATSAAELVYLGVFSSPENYHAFIDAGAIDALVDIVTPPSSFFSSSPKYTALTTMFALAALQNLAASYCGPYYARTEQGESIISDEIHRCEWVWDWGGDVALKIHPDAPKEVIDGEEVRTTLAGKEGFISKVQEIACKGPVKQDEIETPHPGETKRELGHNSPSIVPWAAVGLLKNMALSQSLHGRFKEPELELCMCYLVDSYDWLEADKSSVFFFNIGREQPCHFNDAGDDPSNPQAHLCIDQEWFYEQARESCADYQPSDCEPAGEWIGTDGKTTANEACCVCGGGTRFPLTKSGDEL